MWIYIKSVVGSVCVAINSANCANWIDPVELCKNCVRAQFDEWTLFVSDYIMKNTTSKTNCHIINSLVSFSNHTNSRPRQWEPHTKSKDQLTLTPNECDLRSQILCSTLLRFATFLFVSNWYLFFCFHLEIRVSFRFLH